MNQTESQPASVFYADYLLPLRLANARARVSYLDQEFGRPSYWNGFASRTGGYARVDPSRTDVAALLEDLAAHWQSQGEARLLQLLPELVNLHRRINESATPRDEKSEDVIDYMYPMF